MNKEKKRLYDIEYRKRKAEWIKKRNAASFAKDYAANPEKYKAYRKKRMPKHLEYCRQPTYRKKKKEYDRKRRAKLFYGELWEAAINLFELEAIVDNRLAKAEQKNLSKSQKRKRNGKQTNRQELEASLMGIYSSR